MTLEFSGEIFFWKGPAPFYFVRVPAKESADIHSISASVSYGWGCIQVSARVGETEWKTSLIPKDGLYLVPLKDKVRQAEELNEGDSVRIWLQVGDANPAGRL